MFRYMTRNIYFRIQVERDWLLEIDGERRTMFRMGPVHARDNGPGVCGTEPERSARYQDLLYARTRIGCHRSRWNRLGAYGTPDRRLGE